MKYLPLVIVILIAIIVFFSIYFFIFAPNMEQFNINKMSLDCKKLQHDKLLPTRLNQLCNTAIRKVDELRKERERVDLEELENNLNKRYNH